MKKPETRKCQYLLANLEPCGKPVKKGNRFLCVKHAKKAGGEEGYRYDPMNIKYNSTIKIASLFELGLL